jgi:hypothetical protein
MDIIKSKKVVIELELLGIPVILGALELGQEFEWWCAVLTVPRLRYCSGYASDRWIRYINYMKEEISKQTGINDKDSCYGDCEETVEKIQKILEKQFKKDDRRWMRYERRVHRIYFFDNLFKKLSFIKRHKALDEGHLESKDNEDFPF